MMKYQVELGGKCPVYVTDDVDIESAAASIAEGAFYNTGQSCCAVDRIYVHRRIYDQFEAAFVKEVAKLKTGFDPMDPEVRRVRYSFKFLNRQHSHFDSALLDPLPESNNSVSWSTLLITLCAEEVSFCLEERE